MKPAVPVCVVAALAATASGLAGQQVSFRLGGVRTTYGNAVSGSAAMGTARLAWDAPHLVGMLDASYARFTSGWWASQGAGSVYGIRLLSSNAAIGLRGDGEVGRLSDGAWSGTVAAGPVVSVLLGPLLLSAEASAGALRRIDSLTSATASGALRARTEVGGWSVEGAVETTGARDIRFLDGTLQVAYRDGPIGLTALTGGRTGSIGGKPWLQGRVDYRIMPWATVEAQAGSYPRDISGFTGGSFVSVGVWVRPWRRATGTSAPGLGGLTSSSVKIETVAPGQARVTFVVPGAQEVAIAGEWNDWTPVALVRLDGERWQADVALGKGAHRFSLLVDGGRWVVPPGVPSLPDSFGGTVGLLVVDR